MQPEEFRKLLLHQSAGDIVEQIILANHPGPYLGKDALSALESSVRAKFALDDTQSLTAIVVGSAKLGFATLEKSGREGCPYKPAYREYQPGRSDIDIAVVSPVLYGRIWHDLALFGANQNPFPWRSDLSAYMLHGWLRPDKFPHGGPQRCIDWKEVISDISRSEHFRYKKLRCGIFHSLFFLKIYQQRGILAAQQAERLS